MAAAHAGMNITTAEFTTLVGDLVQALINSQFLKKKKMNCSTFLVRCIPRSLLNSR
jgi:hypothetical protein